MTITQKARYASLEEACPMPWYIDHANDSGICVKDCTGEVVFYEDFGSVPDEAPSWLHKQVRVRAFALAMWMVAFSEDPTA